MPNPTNLRIVRRHRLGLGVDIQFDGPEFNGYQLCVRSKPLHGHQPIEDDPFGSNVWVDDPNGRIAKRVNGEWVRDADGRHVMGRYELRRRRTWTAYGGADAGTGKRYAQAGQPTPIITSELDGPGPWQIKVICSTLPHGEQPSNMIEFDPDAVSPPAPPPPSAERPVSAKKRRQTAIRQLRVRIRAAKQAGDFKAMRLLRTQLRALRGTKKKGAS